MSFDRAALIDACHRHGIVARVVIAAVRGSAPREVGAAMLVWTEGQGGTVGGGALEFELAARARAHLTVGHVARSKHALGPELGQCCGGAVDVLTEVYDLGAAKALPEDMIARGPGPEPLAVTRLHSRLRNAGETPRSRLVAGWMVEPVLAHRHPIWIWGAGHVGRALVAVLTPLPGVEVSWVDTAPYRFPAGVPSDVTILPAADPATLADFAPQDASHLIVTYSHALDLELCHRLLIRGFCTLGLIGSKTKWARFGKRLAEFGHAQDRINRITCPIGNPALGKDPQAIAVGVAYDFLAQEKAVDLVKERRA